MLKTAYKPLFLRDARVAHAGAGPKFAESWAKEAARLKPRSRALEPMSKLQHAPVKDLCPTQLTVGFLEVEAKKKRLSALSPKDQGAFLAGSPHARGIRSGEQMYITDHHHLARAALDLKIEQACFEVEADLSDLSRTSSGAAWTRSPGYIRSISMACGTATRSIPRTLDKLVDDVYRSVAGFVRDAGGYDKTAHRVRGVHLGGLLPAQYRRRGRDRGFRRAP